MSKHTPGPWHVIENPNGTLGIGAKEPDGSDCRPAQINGTAVEEPWASVTWANARLIAAAPDLLEACKRLLAYANRYSDEMRKIGRGADQLGDDADSVSVAGMARAAIAKAQPQP